MRCGPRWSQSEGGPLARAVMAWWSESEGGPLAHAVGASVIPKGRRPSRPCGGGLGGPQAKEAPSPMW